MCRKNVMLLGGVFAVLLFAVALAFPAWMGREVEYRFKETVTMLQENPWFDAKLLSYDRGWFRSYAETELTFHLGGRSKTVLLNHNMVHGLLLNPLRAATIISSAHSRQTDDKATAGPLAEHPARFTTYVGFDGEQSIRLEVPSYEGFAEPGRPTKVKWAAISGNATLPGSLDRMECRLNVPELRVQDQNILATIDDMSLFITAERDPQSETWLPAMEIDMRGFTLHGAEMLDRVPVELAGFTLSTRTTLEPEVVNYFLDVHLDRFISPDGAVENFSSEISLVNIDQTFAEELDQRMTQAAKLGLPEIQTQMLAVQSVLAHLQDILAKKPELALNRLDFAEKGDTFSLSGFVRYVGSGNLAAFAPLRDLQGRLTMDATERHLHEILQNFAEKRLSEEARERGGNPDPEALREMAALSADRMLDQAEAQGILERNGDILSCRMVMGDGIVQINGRSFTSLPGL